VSSPFRELHRLTYSPAGIVSAQRYNDKGEYLYHPPDPDNPPNRPTIGRRPKHS
jgi:hypothetical protein